MHAQKYLQNVNLARGALSAGGEGAGGRIGAVERVLKNLEEDLTCSICLELLTRPVTLTNCGHSFCFLCIRTMVSGQIERSGDVSGGLKYHCPSCRVRIDHPPTAPNHIMAKCVKTLVGAWAPREREEALKMMRETEEQVDKVLDAAREGRCDPWAFFSAQAPIYDEDDGVYRCALCVWELDEDGSCQNSQCGKNWDISRVAGGGEGVAGVRGRQVEAEDEQATSDPGEDEDDVSDGSYESSFIDDAESLARWALVSATCAKCLQGVPMLI